MRSEPQLEVTLHIFSADHASPQKSAPDGQFFSFDTVHEGLLHCVLQTPVFACSLGYSDNPDLFTRLFPKLRRILNLLGSALMHSFTRDERRRLDGFFRRLRRTPIFSAVHPCSRSRGTNVTASTVSLAAQARRSSALYAKSTRTPSC